MQNSDFRHIFPKKSKTSYLYNDYTEHIRNNQYDNTTKRTRDILDYYTNYDDNSIFHFNYYNHPYQKYDYPYRNNYYTNKNIAKQSQPTPKDKYDPAKTYYVLNNNLTVDDIIDGEEAQQLETKIKKEGRKNHVESKVIVSEEEFSKHNDTHKKLKPHTELDGQRLKLLSSDSGPFSKYKIWFVIDNTDTNNHQQIKECLKISKLSINMLKTSNEISYETLLEQIKSTGKVVNVLDSQLWDLKSYQIFEKVTGIKYNKDEHNIVSPFVIRLSNDSN